MRRGETAKRHTERVSKLRAWRLDKGLMLEEVSDLTGLGVSFIGRLERGERRASLGTKVAMARGLETRICDLFGLEPVGLDTDHERG